MKNLDHIHEDWKKYNVFRVFVSSCHVIFETALFPLLLHIYLFQT